MIRRARAHWLKRVLASHGFHAVLAMGAAVGWLHNVVGDLTAHTNDNTAEAAQLRADIRELRMELANCGRHG